MTRDSSLDHSSPEEWLSEQRRLGMVDLYDELEEFREFLVHLHKELKADALIVPVAQRIQNFMDNNTDTWYGGSDDHWRRHMSS